MSQRLDLSISNKNVALQNLSIYYTWKNKSQQYKNNNLKIIAPTPNDELEYQMVLIRYQIITNPPVRVYINRINNRLVFKTNDGYKLALQTPETINLFASTKK